MVVSFGRAGIRNLGGIHRQSSNRFRYIHMRYINTGREGFLTKEERDSLCDSIGVARNRVCVSIHEMRQVRTELSKEATVGFIPTMGALHKGHLSLINYSTSNNDVTVGSIFVNAAQFAPHEDFGTYPRDPVADVRTMIDKGVNYVFLPTQSDMYPGSIFGQTSTSLGRTHVVPKGIDFLSEGAARPGFFTGVATVVCKLFNIVQPTRAYFGQKDGLQCLVIRQMVRDLNFPLQVVPCPTLREDDGLAMSSRNVYLSKEQRTVAPTLYQSLLAVRNAYDQHGERSYDKLIKIGMDLLNERKEIQSSSKTLFSVQYFSICDAVDGTEFGPENTKMLPEQNIMVSAAIDFGDCRILDNILLGEQS
mmetsp:Transcript_14378/g.16701  ORF Transcript_14378/g.16701 Transcript_14378/m.16701 type:complete len:363 (-) Transcript_14378:508-1596(-)